MGEKRRQFGCDAKATTKRYSHESHELWVVFWSSGSSIQDPRRNVPRFVCQSLFLYCYVIRITVNSLLMVIDWRWLFPLLMFYFYSFPKLISSPDLPRPVPTSSNCCLTVFLRSPDDHHHHQIPLLIHYPPPPQSPDKMTPSKHRVLRNKARRVWRSCGARRRTSSVDARRVSVPCLLLCLSLIHYHSLLFLPLFVWTNWIFVSWSASWTVDVRRSTYRLNKNHAQITLIQNNWGVV